MISPTEDIRHSCWRDIKAKLPVYEQFRPRPVINPITKLCVIVMCGGNAAPPLSKSCGAPRICDKRQHAPCPADRHPSADTVSANRQRTPWQAAIWVSFVDAQP